MTKDEALKLALEALEMGLPLIEDFGSKKQFNIQHKAIAAIYEALAQPEQEPVDLIEILTDIQVAILHGDLDCRVAAANALGALITKFEAHPEQEPVAWMCCAFDGKVCEQSNHDECENPIPLYTTPPKRQPLTDDEINKCDMCGYVGKDKDSIGQCPKCRWDELRPLVEKARQKPLTDDQIYDMYNEPRSDAEMLEFARAIEAAHGIKEKNI